MCVCGGGGELYSLKYGGGLLDSLGFGILFGKDISGLLKELIWMIARGSY